MLGKHQKLHMERQHSAFSQCCSRKELLGLSPFSTVASFSFCKSTTNLCPRTLGLARWATVCLTLVLVILMDMGMWKGGWALLGFLRERFPHNSPEEGTQYSLDAYECY